MSLKLDEQVMYKLIIALVVIILLMVLVKILVYWRGQESFYATNQWDVYELCGQNPNETQCDDSNLVNSFPSNPSTNPPVSIEIVNQRYHPPSIR